MDEGLLVGLVIGVLIAVALLALADNDGGPTTQSRPRPNAITGNTTATTDLSSSNQRRIQANDQPVTIVLE